MICELIGASYFRERTWVKIILLSLLTVFFPLVLYFFCCVLSGALIWHLTSHICNKLCCCCNSFFNVMRRMQSYRPNNKCLRITWILISGFFFIVITLIIIGVFLALSLVLGAILWAIAIIPCYIMHFFVMLRILFYWGCKTK